MIRPIVFSGVAFGLIALYAGRVAASDLIVVEAHGIRLTPGQSVDGSQPLNLDDGQQVTLLASSGQIIKIEGPSQTAPDTQVKSGGSDTASAVTALLTERQARTSEVGVVRGEAEVKLPDPWVVDVTHPGTSCLTPGHPVVLWRSEDMGDTKVTIAPADRSWSVSGNWPARADRLTMPNLPLRDQTAYVVNVGGKTAPVTMRLIPASVSNDVMRASWMAEVGCDNQANALLAMLKK